VRARTLVIVGSEDHPDLRAIADILQSKIPGAHKVVIEGASHHPNIGQPREFNRIVLSFLRKSSKTRAPKNNDGSFTQYPLRIRKT
jgi:pimeloyl-ACP methyl ester carboxylesterase